MTPQEQKDIIKKDWDSGLTYQQIGAKIGLSGDQVRQRGRSMNLPPRYEKYTNKKYTILSEHTALAAECETVGIPVEDVKHYWHKGKHFSVFAKGKEVDYEQVKNEIIEDAKKYSPKYPVLKRKKQKDCSLFIIDPADPHFGAYSSKQETGADYNLSIATKRYSEGFEGLIDKGSHYKHEKIIIIGGNDVSHIDNPFRTTTSGTKQDTDGMWFEAFQSAKWANIKIIEQAATIADVHFIHCPSNHDYATGFFLAQTLQAWFRNNKNVTFDVSPSHRKYIQYGVNLIGATHGDGAKEIDLSAAMTREAKKAWSESKYAYWYTHHIHHKQVKAMQGKKRVELEKDGKCVSMINTGLQMTANDYLHVEYIRSIKPEDSWHHRNSFDGSFCAMEGFIHHPYYGQISRLTHLF